MDFSQFDLSEAADAGEWLHLNHPFDGGLMYSGPKETKPCRVKVRGNHSDEMRALLKKHEREMAVLGLRLSRATSAKEIANLSQQIQDAKDRHDDELILCAVIEWENILWHGNPIERSDATVLQVFGRKMGDLRLQVSRKAAAEADFFSSAPRP